MSRKDALGPDNHTRTANMLLLGCSLIGTGCLLYVDDQFLFGLVFVNRPSRIVHFIAVDIESRTRPPSV
jgi:hypothetical protein